MFVCFAEHVAPTFFHARHVYFRNFSSEKDWYEDDPTVQKLEKSEELTRKTCETSSTPLYHGDLFDPVSREMEGKRCKKCKE